MTSATRLRYIRVALVLVGLIFIFGVYPLMMAWWPSGWRWQPNQPEYEQMILGIYATLGVFLLVAARDPLRHLQPDLVHRLVKPRTRCHYGRASDLLPFGARASPG